MSLTSDEQRDEVIHEAYVAWDGNHRSGDGWFEVGSGAVTGSLDPSSRADGGFGAKPEEMLGAAHAACFTMTLTGILAEREHEVRSLRTRAEVRIRVDQDQRPLLRLAIHTLGTVDGISPNEFRRCAELARDTNPLARALSPVVVDLDPILSTGSKRRNPNTTTKGRTR